MKDSKFREMVFSAIDKTIAQGAACMHQGCCAYSNEDGQHCIVGHMMSVDELDTYGSYVGSVDSLRIDGWKPSINSKQAQILTDLQSAHDALTKESDPTEFRRRFKLEVKYYVNDSTPLRNGITEKAAA